MSPREKHLRIALSQAKHTFNEIDCTVDTELAERGMEDAEKAKQEADLMENGPSEEDRKTLREELADLCHSQWSGWMAYLFSKSFMSNNGTIIIPKEYADRWKRQTDSAYKHLSEEEKDSDRLEADKFLELLKQAGGWNE